MNIPKIIIISKERKYYKEIALKNWVKYNDSNSPKVKACIDNELKKVKNRVLIQYIYSIDTHTQEEEEQEEDKEQELAEKYPPEQYYYIKENY